MPAGLCEIGEAIGILHDGVLVFETEDVTSVLMDCCLYDWVKDGKNPVQKYAESHAPAPGTDEYDLLQAYQKARYRIMVPKACLPGAGLHVVDVLSGEQLFLMDVNLSRNPLAGAVPLATRTILLGRYWITGGAPLVIDRKALKLALRRLDREKLLVGDTIADAHRMALIIVGACLESGAAEHVRYFPLLVLSAAVEPLAAHDMNHNCHHLHSFETAVALASMGYHPQRVTENTAAD